MYVIEVIPLTVLPQSVPQVLSYYHDTQLDKGAVVETMVNNRKVSIPSYRVKMGDAIAVRAGSSKSVFFSSLMPQWIKNYQAPPWLLLDPTAITLTVRGVPTIAESGVELADIHSLVEYYSR